MHLSIINQIFFLRHYGTQKEDSSLCVMSDDRFKCKTNSKIPHCRKNSNVKCQDCRKGQIWFPSTHIHDRRLSGFDTGTSIKSGGFKPVSSKLFKDNSIIILFQHKLSINILTVLLAG